MQPELEVLEDRCLPSGTTGPSYVITGSPAPVTGGPTIVRFSPYPGEAAGMASTAEHYDGLPWHLVSRLDHMLLLQYRRFRPRCRLAIVDEVLPMPEEIDVLPTMQRPYGCESRRGQLRIDLNAAAESVCPALLDVLEDL